MMRKGTKLWALLLAASLTAASLAGCGQNEDEPQNEPEKDSTEESGGETTVIGGTLEIKEGASVTGFPQAENQADSTATTVADLKSDFNSLSVLTIEK